MSAPEAAAALSAARRLLGEDSERAAALARQAMSRLDTAEARLVLAAALRRSGDFAGARDLLAALAAEQPGAWGVQFESGVARAALGDAEAAAALARAVAQNPRSALARHALAHQLAILGDDAGAETALTPQGAGSLADPALAEAARRLFDHGPESARALLRDRFNLHLGDVAAVALLAEAGLRLQRHAAVERHLEPWLAKAPGYLPIRHAYVMALQGQSRPTEALNALAPLLEAAPRCIAYRALEAALLVETADYEGALAVYAAILEQRPGEARAWLGYGHVLKTLGRQDDSVAAYRRALAAPPAAGDATAGEAYWSLANLKAGRLDADDAAAMHARLAQADLGRDERVFLHYALARTFEDQGRFEPAFEHCHQGAALHRAGAVHDAEAHHAFVERSIATFTPAVFDARAGTGCDAPDPIFVVGLPRSGSTLVEQMLASHSAVEGASELPYVTALAGGAAGLGERDRTDYPGSLAALDPAAFTALGEAYLARAQPHRRQRRPRFVDKFPGNFLHVGLIHLMLPKARIIDVRRGPLDCGVSLYTQHFAKGQAYSYDLTDIGRYYRDYLALMRHFDAVLPGCVLCVRYEALVADPQAEVRRLLDHCGLAFEASCLRFYDSPRPVRTASSEQVRRPLYSEGVGRWRRFEPWLGPLKAALGAELRDTLSED